MAMGPVAIQSIWSMQASQSESGRMVPGELTPEQREATARSSLNSCHVWDEDGELVKAIRDGEPIEMPIPMRQRLVELS
jgi:hypothetical protein